MLKPKLFNDQKVENSFLGRYIYIFVKRAVYFGTEVWGSYYAPLTKNRVFEVLDASKITWLQNKTYVIANQKGVLDASKITWLQNDTAPALNALTALDASKITWWQKKEGTYYDYN